MTQADVEARMAALSPSLDLSSLADVDMIIEAVFENMPIKKEIFAKLDKIAKPGAILATNTSYLNVDEIASATSRPQDVVGMHFFSPANVMRLLEVVRGKATAKDVLATVMATAKKIKKTAVVSGVCDGFIGNRMIEQYSRQAGFLLDEGCTPAQVDRAVERYDADHFIVERHLQVRLGHDQRRRMAVAKLQRRADDQFVAAHAERDR